jgi:hypothetical protein
VADKHPVTCGFHVLKKFRSLFQFIEIQVEGVAGTDGYIDEITDVTAGAVNESVTKGGIFVIEGYKIKAAGDPRNTGVFFFSPGSPSISVKATGNLAENGYGKIIGTVPELLPDKK